VTTASKYREHILAFADQLDPAATTLRNTEKLRAGASPDGVVVIGMGGSGLAGDLLRHFRKELALPVPIQIWKDYGLPETPFRRPFFLFVSFSGNTEETLSGLRSALKIKGARIGVVTTGGELKRLAEKSAIPLATFKDRGLTPREGVGYTYTACKELLRVRFTKMPKTAGIVRIPLRALEAKGTALARALLGRIPLIYTNATYASIGYVWKIALNETAKQPAFSGIIPEMSHNEVNGFERNRLPLTALFLIDPAASPRIAKRTRTLLKLVSGEGVRTITIPLAGATRVERTWNSIVLAQFTAFALAGRKKIDPSATRLIDALKKSMRA
jgi:glucose/mannose-6-phosphate isomerase